MFFMSLTPKEQKILDYIQSYRDRHGYAPTYAEIQKRFAYKAVSSVQQFIQQLVRKGFLQASMGANRKRALVVADEESDVVALPLEGTVAAGRLTEAVQNREFFEIPKSMLKSSAEYFALKIKGDSMLGDCIMHGDVVVIRMQTHAENGQTVVALVDEAATIKRFFKKRDHIELHPANPNYDIIEIPRHQEVKILGVLASVIRTCSS